MKKIRALAFKELPKTYKGILSAPQCPNGKGHEVIDNGDSWYCYDCNISFGSQ